MNHFAVFPNTIFGNWNCHRCESLFTPVVQHPVWCTRKKHDIGTILDEFILHGMNRKHEQKHLTGTLPLFYNHWKSIIQCTTNSTCTLTESQQHTNDVLKNYQNINGTHDKYWLTISIKIATILYHDGCRGFFMSAEKNIQ